MDQKEAPQNPCFQIPIYHEQIFQSDSHQQSPRFETQYFQNDPQIDKNQGFGFNGSYVDLNEMRLHKKADF